MLNNSADAPGAVVDAQAALARVLGALADSPRWVLVGTPLSDDDDTITAGRNEGLSWHSYRSPRVFVVGEHLLVEQSLAMHIVGWTGSLFAFERAAPQKYVRLPLAQLPTDMAHVLPVSAVAREFADMQLGEGVVADVAGRRMVQAQNQYGTVCQIGLDGLWLSMSAWGFPP